MIKTTTCKQCDNSFTYQTWNSKGSYCSKPCYWQSKKGDSNCAKNYKSIGKPSWNKGLIYKPKEQHHNWKGGLTPYESLKIYRSKNRDKVYHWAKNRSYKLRGASSSHTLQEWKNLLLANGNKCIACGSTEKITKDHIIPISKNGSNNISNIQPLCYICNSRKSNKLDWKGVVLS